MQHEFLWTSMRGSYWIPCQLLATTPHGEKTIRYFDDICQWELEAQVEPAYVREVQPTHIGM